MPCMHVPQQMWSHAAWALAKDLVTAFRSYIEAGTAFLNLSHAPAALHHVQEEAH